MDSQTTPGQYLVPRHGIRWNRNATTILYKVRFVPVLNQGHMVLEAGIGIGDRRIPGHDGGSLTITPMLFLSLSGHALLLLTHKRHATFCEPLQHFGGHILADPSPLPVMVHRCSACQRACAMGFHSVGRTLTGVSPDDCSLGRLQGSTDGERSSSSFSYCIIISRFSSLSTVRLGAGTRHGPWTAAGGRTVACDALLPHRRASGPDAAAALAPAVRVAPRP